MIGNAIYIIHRSFTSCKIWNIISATLYTLNSFLTFQKESQHQRMCSNAAKSDANKYQCGGHATENINAPKKSRPFQTVEKICSALMAILFLMFNALYWPWLLREGDFDYEKFEKAVVKEDA